MGAIRYFKQDELIFKCENLPFGTPCPNKVAETVRDVNVLLSFSGFLSLFLQLHCRQCLSFYYATAMYYFTPNKGAVCCLYARCAQGARDSSTGVRRSGGLAWLVALLLTHLCYNDGSQEIQQLSKAHLNSRTLYYYLLVENTTYLAHLYSSKARNHVFSVLKKETRTIPQIGLFEININFICFSA